MIKEPKIIKDSNDLLGYILFIKDSKNEFSYSEIIDKMGENRSLDMNKYLDELCGKGYINRNNYENGYVYSNSEYFYISPKRKIWLKIRSPLMAFLGYIVGLISDDIKLIFHEIANFIIEIIKK